MKYVAVAVVVAAAALSVQEYFVRHWGGGPMRYSTMAFAQAIGAAVWVAIAFLLILPLARRTTLTPRWIAAHVGAGLIVATLHTIIVAALFASYYYGWSPLAMRDVFRDRMHTGYAWSVFVYLLIAATFVVRFTLRRRAAASDTEGTVTSSAAKYLRRILVKSEGRMTPVPAERIDWLEAADNYVVVHAGGTSHTIRAPLTRLAEQLDPDRFVRVHRSAVLNVDRVREVQNWFHGELVAVLEDQTKVTVGRTYRDQFLALLER